MKEYLKDLEKIKEDILLKVEVLLESLQNFLSNISFKVSETSLSILDNIKKNIGDKLGKLNEKVKSILDITKSKFDSTLESVKEKAKEVINNVNEKFKDIMGPVSDAWQGLIKKMQKQMEKINDKIDFSKMKDNIANAMSTLKEKIKSISDTIASGVKGAIEKTINVAQPILKVGKETIKNITKGTVDFLSSGVEYNRSKEENAEGSGETTETFNQKIDSIKGKAEELRGAMSEGIFNLIKSEGLPILDNMATKLLEAFQTEGIAGFASTLGEVLVQAVTSINELLPSLIETASNIILTLLQGIQESLPIILESGAEILNTLILGIIQLLPGILDIGIKIVLSVINGIINTLPELIPIVLNCINIIITAFLDNLDLIIDTGIALLMALIDGLIASLPILLEKAPEIINKLVNAFVKVIDRLIETGMTIVTKLALGIIQNLPAIGSAALQICTSILNGIGGLLGNVINIGKEIVCGLGQGILSMGDWIYTKVRNFGHNIINSFKKVFGIASPSKVMAKEIGKWLPKGIGLGFDKELNNTVREMQRRIEIETGKMSAKVQTDSTYQVATQSAKALNSVINVQNKTELDGRIIYENNKKYIQRQKLQYGF